VPIMESAVARMLEMELIAPVLHPWKGWVGFVYIILGDADIFCARPGTRHALVSSGPRHSYVYLTSNTTASCYARIHAVSGLPREEERERKRVLSVRESHRTVAVAYPGGGRRRNRKFHLRRESFRDGNSSCSLTTCYLSRIIRWEIWMSDYEKSR